MTSKAEKISHHSRKQPRLSIFFRNPLLLKIVAWLGSLSFIGSTGIVWADLKPISTSQTEAQAFIQASRASAPGTPKSAEREIFGPDLPTAPKPSVEPISPAQLPNREVPVAVAPSSAAISPTGTIVRPKHTDLLTADNYTVGVNGSALAQAATTASIEIPVPAPLSNKIPNLTRERVASTSSQIQPLLKPSQWPMARSVPIVSNQSPAISPQSAQGYQTVPEVTALPTLNSTSASASKANSYTQNPRTIAAERYSTVVKPMTPPVTSGRSNAASSNSSAISVPTSRNQRIEVLPVAQLPKLTGTKVVPAVSAIPSVRPAGSNAQAATTTFTEDRSNLAGGEFIYPLTSPAPTTSGFGWRTHPITGSRRFHSGVDIGAPMGTPVVASGSGVIVSAGWLGGYGKTVVIQHNGIQQTLYGHLSEVFVQPGQRIEQGTVIGRVGSTGNSTGPHLHFEARVSTTDGWVAVDPGEDIKYALDNLRRSMPFAQREFDRVVN
ncbi:M23 family metallopeptidase [Chamaesiphon minutus]|uniref:Metalloendopeptidase-like membrane protein n=1 Tax=Chamaesiphon minutus (strain ATCC 27169 / PCC 6605) TaxID=1173020 RepID=K9UM41_CHAP6|nr:M23 family metallopeptidase [Chamaesiphon minutus]AFY95511.1 metalloendopeptidase-like membrane protein [Chamaesiphon minutus PCC 6605]